MNNVEDKSEDDNGKDEFNGNNREWKENDVITEVNTRTGSGKRMT